MRINSTAAAKDDGRVRLGRRLEFDAGVETQMPNNHDGTLVSIGVVLEEIRSSV